MTRDAITRFSDVFGKSGETGAPADVLQKAYIEDKPNPLREKHLLSAANTGTSYDFVHAQLHPDFRNLLTQHDYYDVFLFSTEGDLVYTVSKALDFATNFAAGGDDRGNPGGDGADGTAGYRA